MEGIHIERIELRKGCFMVKIHLKDAYFMFPVCQKDQKFIRFYEIACLQFGLSRKINLLHAPAESINLQFLTVQFSVGKAHRMLNVYCSAISSTHPSIDSM